MFEAGPLRVPDRRQEFPQTLCKGHLMASSLITFSSPAFFEQHALGRVSLLLDLSDCFKTITADMET